LLALAAIGLALAAYLTFLHVRLHHDPTYVSVCAFGEKVNCESVAASNHSVYFGLPVAVWGLIGYAVVLWAALTQLKRGRQAAGTGMLALFGIALALVSIALAALSSFVIGAVCLFCTATYLVNLAIAITAIARTRRRGGFVACVRGDIEDLLAHPGPAARAVGVWLLIVAAAQVFVPEYWELASWRQGVFGETGVTDDGYPWIGARDPKLTIHEYLDYECPHCKLAHHKLRRILADHPDEMRVVRHDYARMACEPNGPKLKRQSCAMSRAAFCALDQRRFWEWNDAVFAHPRPLTGDARKTYIGEMAQSLGFETGRFDECLLSERTVTRAQAVYLDAKKLKISETPTYVVDGKTHTWEELQDVIDEQL